ncbi:MAG: GNAT family N-acetyltransferase [Pseudomonadota bacterium]
MTAGGEIRRAAPGDAVACAAILNDWIDSRPWMPRVHTRAEVEAFYRDVVFVERKVWVAGTPVEGFLAFDPAAAQVTALYVQRPGQGVGKRLLDHMKARCPTLELWTLEANVDARRFYAREGFAEIARSDGDNEEGLADVKLRWCKWPVRRATVEDAAACAGIVCDWVAETDWIAERFSLAEMAALIAEAIPAREVYVAGDPVAGYLSFHPDKAMVAGLYAACRGDGVGQALLTHVKTDRNFVQLWTHAPNTRAHAFHAREGFEMTGDTRDGDDGHPEFRMAWRR